MAEHQQEILVYTCRIKGCGHRWTTTDFWLAPCPKCGQMNFRWKGPESSGQLLAQNVTFGVKEDRR